MILFSMPSSSSASKSRRAEAEELLFFFVMVTYCCRNLVCTLAFACREQSNLDLQQTRYEGFRSQGSSQSTRQLNFSRRVINLRTHKRRSNRRLHCPLERSREPSIHGRRTGNCRFDPVPRQISPLITELLQFYRGARFKSDKKVFV